MITSRGIWFLVSVLSILLVGVIRNRSELIVLGLTLVLWFIVVGLTFAWRATRLSRQITVQRQLLDVQGPVRALWSGHTYAVRVTIRSRGVTIPFVRVMDRIPYGTEYGKGCADTAGSLDRSTPLDISYSVACPHPGTMRFAGVAMHLADLQGFFYHYAFAPEVSVYRVMPPLVDTEGRQRVVKRGNLLPPPGQHRHLRPGSGSELLNLRDYLPGDPPKTIAWKVSARRDRLITKEFENEVPVRCTLFVDASHSVRLGFTGRNALAQLVAIGSAVAQTAMSARDLIGLCLINENEIVSYLRPARSSRQLGELMQRLTEAAALWPATPEADLAELLRLAYATSRETCPELLQSSCNHVPYWRGLLWPNAKSASRIWWVIRHLGRLPWYAMALVPLIFTGIMVWITGDAYGRDALDAIVRPLVPLPEDLLLLILIAFGISWLVLYWAVVRFTAQIPEKLLAFRERRLFRWRKQLAAILAERANLGAAGLSRLLEDDKAMCLLLQDYLAEHQVPYPVPFYGKDGQYLFASSGKVEILARALLRTVARAHDKELFVLLVDLLDLEDRIGPLLRAVRVVLARHHVAMVICPWPAGTPGPTKRVEPEATENEPDAVARGQIWQQWERSFVGVRRAFARLGVPVVSGGDQEAASLVLRRLEQLRSLGLGSTR